MLAISASCVYGFLGVFALKAAEEYYGQDEDTGGQQTEQHLAALQLDSGASEADIRKAYRTLSVRWYGVHTLFFFPMLISIHRVVSLGSSLGF